MKFSNILLTLLASTSVLSFAVKREEQAQEKELNEKLENLKNMPETDNIPDITNFDLTQLSNLDLSFLGIEKNEECSKVLQGYSDCLIGMNEIDANNKDNVCNVFNSEKCQNFFKNGVKSVKGCENLQDLLLKIEELLVETNSVSLKMQCAKDESGKYCPLSNLPTQFISEVKSSSNSTITEQQYDEAVKATCKSRTCIDAALEFETGANKIKDEIDLFKQQIEGFVNFIGAAQDMPLSIPQAKYSSDSISTNSTTDGNDKLNKTLKYLKSAECTAQAPKKEESSATTLRIGGVVLATILSVLLTFA
jgi:hypothetical protein